MQGEYLVPPPGFEPGTRGLRIRCGRACPKLLKVFQKKGLYRYRKVATIPDL